MCGAPSPGELKAKYLETDEGKQRAEFARAWAEENYGKETGVGNPLAADSKLNVDGKPMTREQAISFFESQFLDKGQYEERTDEYSKTGTAAYQTWADTAKRAAFLGSRQAVKAAPDKTDIYLRNTGLKRATGSQFGSFLGGY